MGILNNAWILAFAFVACSGCDQIRSQAASGLGAKGLDERQRDADVRNQLLARLQGQDEATKLQTLLNIIEAEQDATSRRDALRYASGLGSKAAPIANSLARLFIAETDASIASDIKQALVACDADVEEPLLSAVPNANEAQLLRIMEGLGATGASSPAALEFFREQLGTTNDPKLVMAACGALEQLGPTARPLLPALLALAELPRVPLDVATNNGRAFRASRDVTGAAVRAMAAVGADDSAISVLTDCLGMEPSIAAVAAKALAEVGPAAAPALPALQKLRNRDDHGGKDIKTRLAREAAADAIAAISPAAN